MSTLDALRTAVVCVAPPCETETFIQGHIDHLPGVVETIIGWQPLVSGRPVLSLPERAYLKFRRMTMREDTAVQTTLGYLKAFESFAPDVVLAEYGPMGVAVMEACRQGGVPFVVHFHGYDASTRDVLHIHRETYPKMFQAAASVVAVSTVMARALIAVGCPPEKIVHLPYGIDCTKFWNADPQHAAPVFVAVGRLVDKKAPLATIAAFKQVVRAVPSARLRIVGDGDLRPTCERLIRQLRLDESVTLLGVQPVDVVASEMRAARAFVQHSMVAPSGDSEGTPVAILEASGSGLPIVATRHGGICDAVVEGETGYLVDEGDSNAMAEAMLLLARNSGLAAQMGAAGRARVQRLYTREVYLAGLAGVLARASKRAILEAAAPRVPQEVVRLSDETRRRQVHRTVGRPPSQAARSNI